MGRRGAINSNAMAISPSRAAPAAAVNTKASRPRGSGMSSGLSGAQGSEKKLLNHRVQSLPGLRKKLVPVVPDIASAAAARPSATPSPNIRHANFSLTDDPFTSPILQSPAPPPRTSSLRQVDDAGCPQEHKQAEHTEQVPPARPIAARANAVLEALAELVGPDVEPSSESHFVDDEREWQELEDLDQNGDPPRGKWPVHEYARFLRLRLPELRELPVTVVPGIDADAAERLSKQGVRTVCCSIYLYSYLSVL